MDKRERENFFDLDLFRCSMKKIMSKADLTKKKIVFLTNNPYMCCCSKIYSVISFHFQVKHSRNYIFILSTEQGTL